MRTLQLLLPIALLAACSRGPIPLDKLPIQAVEVGPVPASTIPNLPAEEGVVTYTRGNAGILTAVYRKTVACPSRMINSVSGIKALPDRIQLCFEPIEATSPEARPLSPCPYNLAIKYEMTGIPESVKPVFEPVKSCKGFAN